MSEVVEIYTDGACRGNPGPGGWGAMLSCQGKVKKIHGGEIDTTNNRMELLAAIKALSALKVNSQVVLYTDSNYVRQGITSWIHNWKKRGWRTSSKQAVKNSDLWQALDVLNSQHQIDWRWVKGHSGDPGNEMADELANRGVDDVMRGS